MDQILHLLETRPDALSHSTLLSLLLMAGAFLAPAFHSARCGCRRCVAAVRRRLGLE